MIQENLKTRDGKEVEVRSYCCNEPINITGLIIKKPRCTKCRKITAEVYNVINH